MWRSKAFFGAASSVIAGVIVGTLGWPSAISSPPGCSLSDSWHY
jgi:hypothetical protein